MAGSAASAHLVGTGGPCPAVLNQRRSTFLAENKVRASVEHKSPRQYPKDYFCLSLEAPKLYDAWAFSYDFHV